MNATLEDRIKTLSSVSNTSYTDTPSALDEIYDRFVCNSLHKQLLENSRIYKSLKKNIEEATNIINKSSSSASQTSSLPSLKKTTKNRRLGKSKSHKINTITSLDNENEKSDTITSGENNKTDTLTIDTQDGENNENNKFKRRPKK